VTLTFDLLTLKVVSESLVTCVTSMPILVFLCLSVLDLGPMYATDVRQTDVRQKHRFMPAPIRGGGMRSGILSNGERILCTGLIGY